MTDTSVKDEIVIGIKDILNTVEVFANYFNEFLLKNKKAYDYCRVERKLSDKALKTFKVGYVPSEEFIAKFCKAHNLSTNILYHIGILPLFTKRIVFPIFDLDRRVIGFSGRTFIKNDDRAKYVNTYNNEIYNKSLALFGIGITHPYIRKENSVIVVEGNLDVISLIQAGIRNVVAPCGTALTEEQLLILKIFTNNVVGWFDNDAAGKIATKKAQKLCQQLGMTYRNLGITDAKDPDEFVKKYDIQFIKDKLNNKGQLCVKN